MALLAYGVASRTMWVQLDRGIYEERETFKCQKKVGAAAKSEVARNRKEMFFGFSPSLSFPDLPVAAAYTWGLSDLMWVTTPRARSRGRKEPEKNRELFFAEVHPYSPEFVIGFRSLPGRDSAYAWQVSISLGVVQSHLLVYGCSVNGLLQRPAVLCGESGGEWGGHCT